ncbi:pyridoxal phosphate-dependent aminotransferase [Thermofilum pendens]|uniref:Aminotransferase n=1 Tax=Thermofilum pendens (strain DSM 2475 / Hrk 5) TaxID=368408 RepID=A1S0S9_THEPD|nr:pyridoxal phosphate-dependent aminotransferase [Thermofilum pendens]ABL79059.1 L-aspartate aminotransferase [Thermofilum pendens Hrk 5]
MPKPTLVFSPLAEQLEPEGAFVYLDLAAEARRKGIDVISFGIGQPDFQPPREALEAIKEALDRGYTRYISPLGIPELREEIARYVGEKYGVDVKPSEVAVTVGAKAALFMTISLLTRPGDEVVVQDPAFPTYECVIRYAGGRPVFVRLAEERGFRLSAEDVERTVEGLHRVRGIVVNSPHNPTGSALEEKDVEALLELARRKGMFVISDEIYEDYVYEGKHASFLQAPDWRDYVVYVSGFSKTWAMTGLRLGYVVAREEVIRALEVFATNMYSCPPAPLQYGALKALQLGTGWFKPLLEEYRRRRDAAFEELSKIPGVSTVKSRGAFYLFPNFKEVLRATGLRSVDELAKRLLFEAGVVLLPGTAFPLRGGDGYMRVSYVLPVEKIREGFGRVREWVEKNAGG